MISELVDGRVRLVELGERVVGDDVEFVYIMRTDTSYVCDEFASRMGLAAECMPSLVEQYEWFVVRLASLLGDAFATERPGIVIDLLDGRAIDRRRRELIPAGSVVVSLDPLMADALPLAFSRCYAMGGRDFLLMLPRPGYPTMEAQLEAIQATGADVPITVVEDDIYTGETLSQTMRTYLGPVHSRITTIVAGTRIGGVGLDGQPYETRAAIVYRTPQGTSAIDKIDLGDPRDYLIGASGLVVRLPDDRGLGRLPYLLPFVSTAARASIPTASEIEFAREALALGGRFYAALEGIAGRPVVLGDCDPHFVAAIEATMGLDATTSIHDLIAVATDQITTLSATFGAR